MATDFKAKTAQFAWAAEEFRDIDLGNNRLDKWLTYVVDREAGSLKWMLKAQALGHPVDRLIRARHNRLLPNGQRL